MIIILSQSRAEEFGKQFTFLEENIEKYITFTVPIEKELTRINKNGKKLQKIYPKYNNLLIAQNLWQAHYQILSIIFLKEFIELNVNTDMMIKYVKLVEFNISIVTEFLKTQTLKMIKQNTNDYVVTKIINKVLMKN